MVLGYITRVVLIAIDLHSSSADRLALVMHFWLKCPLASHDQQCLNIETTRKWTGRHATKSILTKSASWQLLCQGVFFSHLHLIGKDSGYRIKTKTSSGKGYEGWGVFWIAGKHLKAVTPCLHALSCSGLDRKPCKELSVRVSIGYVSLEEDSFNVVGSFIPF